MGNWSEVRVMRDVANNHAEPGRTGYIPFGGVRMSRALGMTDREVFQGEVQAPCPARCKRNESRSTPQAAFLALELGAWSLELS